MADKNQIDYEQKRFRFTKAALDRIPTGAGIAYWYDDEVKKLGITRQRSGRLNFHVRTVVDGATKRIAIKNGAYPGMTIDTARREAARILADVGDGRDPVLERRRNRAAKRMAELTVEEGVLRFCRDKRRNVSGAKLPLKERTQEDYKWKIERLLGDDYKKPITSINYELLRKRERLIPSTVAAGGMRSLSSVWNWLSDRAEYEGKLPANPVLEFKRREDGLHRPHPKDTRLHRDDFPVFLDAVEGFKEVPRQALLWLILTGNRLSEVKSLDWSVFDWRDSTYTLLDPKNRRDALLPIPPSMVVQLKTRFGREKRGSVFPCNVRHHMGLVSDRLGYHVTAHDLRRTHMGLCDASISSVSGKRLQNRALTGVDEFYVGTSANLQTEIAKVESLFYSLAGKPTANVSQLQVIK